MNLQLQSAEFQLCIEKGWSDDSVAPVDDYEALLWSITIIFFDFKSMHKNALKDDNLCQCIG